MSLFFHALGLDNPSGPWYLFWSGFAGDLGIFVFLVGAYKSHNCHVHRCWRLGKYEVAYTPYKVCKIHHKDVPKHVKV